MQVPQFLLDAAIEAGGGGAASLVCTQPRRIAAISVAERVAAERGQPAPGAEGAMVGAPAALCPRHARKRHGNDVLEAGSAAAQRVFRRSQR
jgi:hypothetical protein